MAPEEKAELLLHLRHVVNEGVGLHQDDRELMQLAKDLEREYLLLATS